MNLFLGLSHFFFSNYEHKLNMYDRLKVKLHLSSIRKFVQYFLWGKFITIYVFLGKNYTRPIVWRECLKRTLCFLVKGCMQKRRGEGLLKFPLC